MLEEIINSCCTAKNMNRVNKLVVASIFLSIMFVLMYMGITPDIANASTSGSIIMNYDYDGGTDADCGLLLANNICIPIGDGVGYRLGPQPGQWDNCLNSAVKYASGLSDISGLQISYDTLPQQPPACISNEGHAGDETPLLTFTTYKVSFAPKCNPNNTKQCVGNSIYNFDSCGAQGSLYQTCYQGQTCQNGQCVNVTCSNNSNCGTNAYMGSPYCQGGDAYQNFKTYICNNPGTANSTCSDSIAPQLKSNCTGNQTCDDGQCKNANIACSINAQCGTDGYPNSPYCKGGNVYQDYKTYTCLNPGTASSFCFNSTSIQSKLNCNANQTCNNGSCENLNIICNTNSQCGTNAYTGSPYCQGGDIYQNYKTYVCNNPGTANSVCSDSTAPQLKSNCASGQTCTNGSCLTSNITCSTSAQCGNNALTGNPFCQNNNVFTNQLTYYCNNPGTSQSFCSSLLVPQLTKSCGTNKTCSNGDCASQSIACGSNTDCGSNGLTGNAFCQDDGVYKNYMTYSCNNPGTSQSFCSNSTTPQLTQTCSTNQSCVNGSCTNLNIACSINAQCGADAYLDSPYCQGNSTYQNYKTYTCLNPGTGNSFCSNSTAPKLKSDCTGNQTCSNGSCTNVNIACSTNTGCGTNQYTGSPYCQNGDIYQNYKTYTCSNPGAANSVCSDSTAPQLKSSCTGNQTCANGQCQNVNIACSTNTGCGTNQYTGSPYCQNGDIYQNYKTYTCSNPGAANSACSDSTAPQLKSNCTGNQTCSNGSCANQNIICNNNSDCGTNNYTGNLSCQGNNVYQSYITYTCNNAGTSSSYCSNSTASQFKNSCTGNQTCSNGNCSGTNCTYHSYQQCLGNNLYWFNSCGVQQDLIQYCQNGCSNNTCNNNQQTYLAVQTNSATNTYNNQATLNGYLSGTNTNDINYVWFQWGTTTSYSTNGYETNHQTKNYSGSFSQNIAGLTPGVVYHFRAVAQSNNGQIIYGQDMTFQLGQILGATDVSTGLTNNFLVDSFFLPLMIALAGIWLFKSGILNAGAWADGKKMKRIDYIASKKLKTRITEIKERESWPKI